MTSHIKIDELKTPPIVGETYLVPCILKESLILKKRLDDWNPIKDNEKYFMHYIVWNEKEIEVYPIINHKHSDKENGQDYEHYHVDYRFVIMDVKKL